MKRKTATKLGGHERLKHAAFFTVIFTVRDTSAAAIVAVPRCCVARFGCHPVSEQRGARPWRCRRRPSERHWWHTSKTLLRHFGAKMTYFVQQQMTIDKFLKPLPSTRQPAGFQRPPRHTTKLHALPSLHHSTLFSHNFTAQPFKTAKFHPPSPC